MEAGADSITAHLREDRRHIKDHDLERLKTEVPLPLNLEMAMTEEMLAIALRLRPHAVCLVPEKREEITTEGGLDAIKFETKLTPYVHKLQQNGSRVSLFIAPIIAQVEAAARTGARVIELHTGAYADFGLANEAEKEKYELAALTSAAQTGHSLGLEVHAGHGLSFTNVGAIAKLPHIAELNIGHFLIGEAMFIGLKEAITKMRTAINGGNI